MVTMLRSDIFRRFAGGFVAGAIAIVLVQPPEGAIRVLEVLKSTIA